ICSGWRREDRRPLRGGGFAAALPAPGFLRGGAGGAEVVQVVWVFHQPVVHVVAHLLARRADEVDAFDGLVDALAVQDASAKLLDPDAEELLVLALDLAPPGLVLREILLAVVGLVILRVEEVEATTLALGTVLVRLACPCHRGHVPPKLSASAPGSRSSCRRPRSTRADRTP